jgi:hypothetical protein
VNAVRVTVPATGRLRLTLSNAAAPGAEFVGLVLPGGRWYPLKNARNYYGTLYFEDHRPIANAFGRLRGAGGDGALVSHAGDRVTVIAGGAAMTVWKSVAQTASTTVDAAAVSLPPAAVPYSDYHVQFDAVAGTWLHGEVLGAGGRPEFDAQLIGPHGRLFDNALWWRVPTTGQYTMVVPTDSTAQVRIRKIRVLDPVVPVDGTAVTFTATRPGEWVMAPMNLGETGLYRLSAPSSSTTGDWQAIATGQGTLHCGGANGCGDWSYGLVSQEQATSLDTFGTQSGLGNPWLVMFEPDPGTTGTVSLSVQPAS